jgi:hypothetical protein
MKTSSKKLILTIQEDGAIGPVHAQASPEAVYEKLFNSATRKAKKHPNSFDNGIQVVIFGALLLEALCNERFRDLLFRVVQNVEHAQAIWDVTRRIQIYDKVKIASKITHAETAAKRDNLGSLRTLFDLRNRLAHFKDNPSLLHETLDASDLETLFESVPDPDLIMLLTGDKLKEQIANVERLKKWITGVFDVQTRQTKMPRKA